VHVTIHRVGALPATGPVARLDQREVPTLRTDSYALAPLAVTFESAAAALEALPRLYFEPDGSFVWTGEHTAWQLDGQLHDRGETLDYAELKGTCPPNALAALLAALRRAEEPLVFHCVREGIFVDEPTATALMNNAS
jgi:hypothetical protein